MTMRSRSDWLWCHTEKPFYRPGLKMVMAGLLVWALLGGCCLLLVKPVIEAMGHGTHIARLR